MPLAKMNLWVGDACVSLRCGQKAGGGDSDLGSAESSCQDAAFLVPGTCLLLSFSGADFTSCWVQSLHHLCSEPQPGHELLMVPSLRNPSQGLSHFP